MVLMRINLQDPITDMTKVEYGKTRVLAAKFDLFYHSTR